MKLFIALVAAGFLLGGLVGIGMDYHGDFSITWGIAGIALVVFIFFGREAVFEYRVKNIKKNNGQNESIVNVEELHNQRRNEPKVQQISKSKIRKGKYKQVDDYLLSVSSFFQMMLPPSLVKIDDVYERILSNKIALGYLFGVHAHIIMKGELKGCTLAEINDIMDLSYQDIFGFVDGYNLFTETLQSLKDEEFRIGKKKGVDAVVKYKEENIYPADFFSIVGLGYLD